MSLRTVDLDGWVYGDNDSTLTLTLKQDDGTPYDFTGASAVTLVCWPVGSKVASEQVTISGAVYGTATNGQIRFSSVAAAAGMAPTYLGQSVAWAAVPKWTKSATTRWARTQYRFSLTRLA